MSSRTVAATVFASLLCLSGAAPAQTVPGDLMFEVPLNLTRLSPFITTVAVTCTLGSNTREAATQRVEAPVTAGAVVGTLPVIFPASTRTSFKVGETLNYECVLTGLISAPATDTSLAASGWNPFDAKMGDAYNVSPPPAPITGSLVW